MTKLASPKGRFQNGSQNKSTEIRLCLLVSRRLNLNYARAREIGAIVVTESKSDTRQTQKPL